MKDLIIDYLEGNLTGELNSFVANHIKKSEQWTREHENLKMLLEVIENNDELTPPATLKADFDKMLAHEMAQTDIHVPETKDAKTISWPNPKMWLQIAASVVLVIIGVYAGNKISSNANQEEIMALRTEMEVTKKLVLSSLQNQSASSRINAVKATYKISVDDDIVRALIKTMNTDENANVRLAAIDALSEFADEKNIRTALIDALSTQDMPVVQIALINLMVQLKESRAINALKKIIDDENEIITVRDEASYGLIRL